MSDIGGHSGSDVGHLGSDVGCWLVGGLVGWLISWLVDWWVGPARRTPVGSADDGKRAFSAIEVECKAARPLGGCGGNEPGRLCEVMRIQSDGVLFLFFLDSKNR